MIACAGEIEPNSRLRPAGDICYSQTSMKNVAASLLLLSFTLLPLHAAAAPVATAPIDTSTREFHPRWSQLAQQDLRPALREAIAQAQRRYEGIAQLREEEMNFENTYGVLDACSYDIASLTQIIFVLTIIADTPQVRANMTSMLQQHAQYSSEAKQNRPLWQALERAAAQPWVQDLSPERRLYIRDTLREYKQMGGQLDENKHKQLQAITVRLTQLSEQFKANIIASTRAWQHITADRAQLLGLSDARLDSLAQQARARGYGSEEQPQWLLTLELQCAYVILQYCEVEATRRLMWEALEGVATQAPYDNRAVIRETLQLRQQYAELLGHSNYADYAAQNAMLETGAAALDFVDQSLEKLYAQSQSEQEKLLAFVSERRGVETHSLEAWNASYYLCQYHAQQQQKQVSSWGLFPAGYTLERIFSVFETLFAIRIQPVVDAEVWHPDVRAYGIYDRGSQEKKHLGTFYLDQYGREGKAAGAWTTPIHTGSTGSREARHLSIVRSNFYKPEEGEKYYSISELITLFHELGHVMHLTISDVELFSQAGLKAPMDFIEMPSQLMEKWVADEHILASLSKSVFTGEPITPQEAAALFQHYQSFDIWDDLMQLGQAKLDLEMHLNYRSQFAEQDIDEAAHRILSTAQFPYKRQLYFLHTWEHVFGNSYGAGYYGYDWTKLLAEDAFTRFRGEGLMNPETGRALRESILEQGKSVPAAQQYRDFMGRDPRL